MIPHESSVRGIKEEGKKGLMYSMQMSSLYENEIGVVGPGAIGLLYTFYLQKVIKMLRCLQGQLSRLTN